MKIISHRGNLFGPNEEENEPNKIISVIQDHKFDVEIDLWLKNEKLYLGHDRPENEIDLNFLKKFSDSLWIHIKNIECIDKIKEHNLNWFWHENDKMTLTSKGHMWCYPDNYIKNGITVVLQENINIPPYCLGICTDYVYSYKI